MKAEQPVGTDPKTVWPFGSVIEGRGTASRPTIPGGSTSLRDENCVRSDLGTSHHQTSQTRASNLLWYLYEA